MKKTRIREATAEPPVKSGDNRWRVIVAKPGKGSSATYSAEVLKRDAQKIVPPGAQSFFNHDEDRDPRDMLGVFPDGAIWSEDDQAVVAELSVFDSWKPLVEQLAPHVGISLYARAELDESGNVSSFLDDAYNGADLVARGGLKGAGFDEKLYEAARSASTKQEAGKSPSSERKDTKSMDEVLNAIKALSTKVSALVSAQETKAAEQAQVEADEKVAEERVEAYASNVAAIESARAELLPSQVTHLLAEAKKGDIANQIESAKALVKEMREDVAETHDPTGRVVGSTQYESAADLGKVFG